MGGQGLNDPELLHTLRRTNDRLKSMVHASIQRILEGSEDPVAMDTAYAALRGEASATEGVDALRNALVADGIDADARRQIEALYLNALVGA